jgi:hypothetical protein
LRLVGALYTIPDFQQQLRGCMIPCVSRCQHRRARIII